MRRDIGNEIIVAIAAIGMLAIAIIFAIILSLSHTAENAMTPTVPGETSIAANATSQAVIPSAPQNVDTSTPTVPTATFTPLMPTETFTPSATTTPIPTTAQASATRRVSKPSPTTTKAEVTVEAASPTPQPPVPTHTPTQTLIPTQAASSTPKSTASRTASPIPPTSTFTATVRPSVTPLPPTHTPAPSDTYTPSPIPASSTPQPTATPILISPTPMLPTGDAPVVEGCADSGAQISSPPPGQALKGMVKIIGTAYDQDLLYYKIETRPDFSQFYTLYDRYEAVVIQSELGEIDTKIFSPGMYWIKITVVNKNNTIAASCAIPVTIQR